jgi:hypothetical protein
MLPYQSLVLQLVLFATYWHYGTALAGSTAQPFQKQKIAVLGGGGYTGGLVFGFLQRAGSLYETGIDRSVRCLGATQDTAVQLNRILSKHFGLAMADESYIKLTNFKDPASIASRLARYDALVLGAGLETKVRPVTPNTYETTPNDKTMELYWQGTTNNDTNEPNQEAFQIVQTVIQASPHLKHIVALDPRGSFLTLLQEGSVPFTCLQTSSPILTTKDYTYRKGVQTPLSISSSTATSSDPLYVEDLAALAVQCLLSLDWSTSRSLHVSRATTAIPPTNPKRPDQEWCVNSYQLEAALRTTTIAK